MLVEAITTATFSNGILRLEVATINGRGEQVVSGNIEIPGNQVFRRRNLVSSKVELTAIV